MPRQSSALIAFHGNVTTTMQERKISLGYPAVSRIWHFAFAFALLKFLDPLLPFLHLLLLAFLNTPVRHQKSWYFPFCIISLACPFWWPPTESLSRFLARSLSLSLSIYISLFVSLSFFLLLPFFSFPYPSFLSTLPLLLSNLKPKSAKSFHAASALFKFPGLPSCHSPLSTLPLAPASLSLRRQSLAFSMVL